MSSGNRRNVGLGRDATFDPWIDHALREIYSTYGEDASTIRKAKSLTKFGTTRNADQNTKTTIADFQGTVANETLSTTNDIDSIISTSGSDTGVMTIEGHTIDASGNLTFVGQDVTLTGQTRKALTTPLARATRAYVKDGTFASPASSLAGIVSVYDDAGGDNGSGVPSVDAAVKLRVRGDLGTNQSEKSATSTSSTDYWILTELHFGIRRGSGLAVTADFEIEVRRLGGVFRPLGVEANMKTSVSVFELVGLKPYVIVPPNSDVRSVVVTDTNDTFAEARIEGILASVHDNDYGDV